MLATNAAKGGGTWLCFWVMLPPRRWVQVEALMSQGSETVWWPVWVSCGLRRSLGDDKSGDSCVASFS